MTTACKLLRALGRVIHEEMWTSNFEYTFKDKKGENQDDKMFYPRLRQSDYYQCYYYFSLPF